MGGGLGGESGVVGGGEMRLEAGESWEARSRPKLSLNSTYSPFTQAQATGKKLLEPGGAETMSCS